MPPGGNIETDFSRSAHQNCFALGLNVCAPELENLGTPDVPLHSAVVAHRSLTDYLSMGYSLRLFGRRSTFCRELFIQLQNYKHTNIN